MTKVIIDLHPILTIVLLVCYVVLIVRNLTGGSKVLGLDKFVMLVARLSLALLIFTGLMMSISYKIAVSWWHHILCLIPIVIILVYQGMAKKGQVTAKKNAIVFGLLFLSVVAITLVA